MRKRLSFRPLWAGLYLALEDPKSAAPDAVRWTIERVQGGWWIFRAGEPMCGPFKNVKEARPVADEVLAAFLAGELELESGSRVEIVQ